ncbi:glucosaminidase domain-containing protein [Breznakia sp. OttesenSCG-928-G09]|nr:glucosaminidase domain-containing protein [Breznakia sp. OttesenSCG-928-G09]
MKKIKSLAIILCTIAMLAGMISYDYNHNLVNIYGEDIEIEDNFEAEETLPDNQEITTMDKDGNILPADNVVETSETSENQMDSTSEDGISTRAAKVDYAVVNFNTKSADKNTEYTEYKTGRTGYTNGNYGADAAYIEHSSDGKRIRFVQAGVMGWVSASEVEVIKYSTAKTCNYYAVRDGRLYHFITLNVMGTTYSSQLDMGAKPSYMNVGKAYYSYDGHYFYTTFAKMIDDYRNGHYKNAVNYTNPYYNYYQFLSHRSTSAFTSTQINSYISSKSISSSKMRNMGTYFKQYEKTYGSNALLMMAVAANESAWGSSTIAQQKNNLFGHAAYDSAPGGSSTAYANPQTSIYVHAKSFISEGYLDPCDGSTASSGFRDSVCLLGRYYGSHLGDKASGINVKYASDPYWGEKAAAIAWNADTAIKANDNDGIIGIKNSRNNVSVYKEASTSSAVLYKTGTSENYSFIVVAKTTGTTVNGSNVWYKIQSDPVLNSARTKLIQDNGTYSFTKDYAYVHSSQINLASDIEICENIQSAVPTTPNGVVYQTYIRGSCWQDWKSNAITAGTTGKGLPIDSIRLSVNGYGSNAKITYRVYQNGSWRGWWSNGLTAAGNPDWKKPIEAVQIKLENMPGYKVEYRTHVSNIGWQEWQSNGVTAGSIGQSKQVEAIEVRIVEDPTAPTYTNTLTYQTHIQNIGWQAWKNDGEISGTSGQSKRLEAIKIKLSDTEYSGGISYSTHIQNIGWQAWKNDGALSGTSGQSKRLEAIKIKLTGEMAEHYDIYYRVHAQNFGWLGWSKNGEISGTAGYGYRLEAVQIKLVKKGEAAPGSTVNAYRHPLVSYQTHIQNIGWQAYKKDGETSGTSGQSKRLEAIRLNVNNHTTSGGITYRTHIQNIGWQGWKSNGALSGTSGQSKRLEAVQIKLTGKLAEEYDVYYRVHAQKFGWMGWAKNGASAGTSGYSYRLEAIQVKLVKKGGAAPGSTANPYKAK